MSCFRFQIDCVRSKNVPHPFWNVVPYAASIFPSCHARKPRVSAMYNMFVDADVLSTIQDVAGRLAASAVTPDLWASTELGQIVHFTDDRSQDRVRKIFSCYTDGTLQDKDVFMRVRRERSSFLATYMSQGGNTLSRAMGLSSFRLAETMEANAKMRRKCTNQFFPVSFFVSNQPCSTEHQSGQGRQLLFISKPRSTSCTVQYMVSTMLLVEKY